MNGRTMLVHAFLHRDLELVLEGVVRRLEGVAELVTPRRCSRPGAAPSPVAPRVDRPADRPERTGAALDPDDDLVTGAVLADPVQRRVARTASSSSRTPRGKDTIVRVSFFGRLFGKGGDEKPDEPQRGSISKEEALAAYVIREHSQGRPVEEILDDPYLKNRATEEQRIRLLERPEVIRAIGEHTAEMARERVRES